MLSDAQRQWLDRMLQLPMSQEGEEADFACRLAEEQAWTRGYALAVTDEYRRFLALAGVSPQPVTPSRDVDAAWHLHMTRTREYARMSQECFGRFLHHEASAGGGDERARYSAQYEATLARYREVFGSEPPQDIWPSAEQRFSLLPVDPPSGLVLPTLLRHHVTAMLVVGAVAWAAGLVGSVLLPSSTPLAGVRGVPLLLAYLLVWIAAAWWGRQWRRSAVAELKPVRLDTYEIACLAAGPDRVATAGIGAAVAQGRLELRTQRKEDGSLSGGELVRRDHAPTGELHPVEVTASRGDAGPVDPTELRARLATAGAGIEHRLRRAGLLSLPGHIGWRELAWLWPSFLLLVWACARLGSLIGGTAPWGLLAGLALLHTASLAWGIVHRPRLSLLGQASLKAAERGVARSIAPASEAAAPGWARQVALAIAVAGTAAVIQDPRFAGINFVVGEPSDQTGNSGSAAGCGAGDGGGCGGCGGCGG